MERTLRVAKEFQAEDDTAAERVAARLLMETEDEEYEDGNCEYDYSLTSEDGKIIVWWNGG